MFRRSAGPLLLASSVAAQLLVSAPAASAASVAENSGQVPSAALVSSAAYNLYNVETGRCIDLPGVWKGRPGGPTRQTRCNYTAVENQRFFLLRNGTSAGRAVYLFRNKTDGLCLDLPHYGKVAPRTRVTEFHCRRHNDNQSFIAEPVGPGTFLFRHQKSPGLCLDVEFLRARKDGVGLMLWPCDRTSDDHLWAPITSGTQIRSVARPSAAYLEPGQTLKGCSSMTSPSGVYRLGLRCNADLELLAPGSRRLWRSDRPTGVDIEPGNPHVRLSIEPSGELRVINTAGGTRWSVRGAAGSSLVLQDDGNLLLRTPAGHVSWASRTARYQHFLRAADYIAREMVRNGAELEAASLPARRLRFFARVREGQPWDHKNALRRALPLTTDDSYYFDVPGLARTALSYDFFSNLHYGYVGRRAGFTHAELLGFQRVHVPGVTGRPDPGDDVSVRAGMALADRGVAPSASIVGAAARESIAAFRAGRHAQVRDLVY